MRKSPEKFVYKHECHEHIAVWFMRILINLDTWKSSSIEHHENHLRVIGLTEKQCEKLDKAELLKLLKKTKNKIEKNSPQRDSQAESNLLWLQRLMGLTDIEVEILCFTICISTFKPLDTVSSEIGILTRPGVSKVLAVILDIPSSEISRALSSKGNLLISGLLKIEKSSNADLESGLPIFTPNAR